VVLVNGGAEGEGGHGGVPFGDTDFTDCADFLNTNDANGRMTFVHFIIGRDKSKESCSRFKILVCIRQFRCKCNKC
jgi:hypothetical protein